VPIKEASCICSKLFIKIIFCYLIPRSLTLMGGVWNLKDVNHPFGYFDTLDFFASKTNHMSKVELFLKNMQISMTNECSWHTAHYSSLIE
jgi:hypothetical protein